MKLQKNSRIIIDGYNLIFQVGFHGRSKTSVALERGRERLISTIANAFSAEQRRQVTIVFDAEKLPIKEESIYSERDGIHVIYALDFDDADSLIEELIRSHSNPKQLTVVSSDHRIHKAALRRKATPIDSDVWLDQVESGDAFEENSNQGDSGKSKDLPASFDDVDWAKEFGLDQD